MDSDRHLAAGPGDAYDRPVAALDHAGERGLHAGDITQILGPEGPHEGRLVKLEEFTVGRDIHACDEDIDAAPRVEDPCGGCLGLRRIARIHWRRERIVTRLAHRRRETVDRVLPPRRNNGPRALRRKVTRDRLTQRTGRARDPNHFVSEIEVHCDFHPCECANPIRPNCHLAGPFASGKPVPGAPNLRFLWQCASGRLRVDRRWAACFA